MNLPTTLFLTCGEIVRAMWRFAISNRLEVVPLAVLSFCRIVSMIIRAEGQKGGGFS